MARNGVGRQMRRRFLIALVMGCLIGITALTHVAFESDYDAVFGQWRLPDLGGFLSSCGYWPPSAEKLKLHIALRNLRMAFLFANYGVQFMAVPGLILCLLFKLNEHRRPLVRRGAQTCLLSLGILLALWISGFLFGFVIEWNCGSHLFSIFVAFRLAGLAVTFFLNHCIELFLVAFFVICVWSLLMVRVLPLKSAREH